MFETEKIIIPTYDNVELEAEYYQSTQKALLLLYDDNVPDKEPIVLICHPHPQIN
ncbi:MAG: hypothetical protein ACTSQJ_12240 [Promethearchaeota archaeon]